MATKLAVLRGVVAAQPRLASAPLGLLPKHRMRSPLFVRSMASKPPAKSGGGFFSDLAAKFNEGMKEHAPDEPEDPKVRRACSSASWPGHRNPSWYLRRSNRRCFRSHLAPWCVLLQKTTGKDKDAPSETSKVAEEAAAKFESTKKAFSEAFYRHDKPDEKAKVAGEQKTDGKADAQKEIPAEEATSGPWTKLVEVRCCYSSDAHGCSAVAHVISSRELGYPAWLPSLTIMMLTPPSFSLCRRASGSAIPPLPTAAAPPQFVRMAKTELVDDSTQMQRAAPYAPLRDRRRSAVERPMPKMEEDK